MSSKPSSITVTNAAEQKPPFILGICRKLKLNIVASPIEYCEQHLFMNFTGCLIHDIYAVLRLLALVSIGVIGNTYSSRVLCRVTCFYKGLMNTTGQVRIFVCLRVHLDLSQSLSWWPCKLQVTACLYLQLFAHTCTCSSCCYIWTWYLSMYTSMFVKNHR